MLRRCLAAFVAAAAGMFSRLGGSRSRTFAVESSRLSPPDVLTDPHGRSGIVHRSRDACWRGVLFSRSPAKRAKLARRAGAR